MSVRIRLLIIALLPMLILMPLLLGVTTQRWTYRTDQILAARVASDLTVAQQYLLHLTENTASDIRALGESAAFRDAVAPPARGPSLFNTAPLYTAPLDMGRAPAGQSHTDATQGDQSPSLYPRHGANTGPPPNQAAFLTDARHRLGLDFLRLLPAGDLPRDGILALSAEALAALNPDLPARAHLDMADGAALTKAMVIRASLPVTLPQGPAILTGGILLNGNDAFVDRINDLVYPPAATLAEKGFDTRNIDRGITSLFLGDIRIATTLRPEGTARAVGTRASPEVSARVLDQGGSWHDTALVVKDWYISAYEAITDPEGNRIGMLYTGIPRAPYTEARRLTWAITIGAFLAIAALTVPLFLTWARGIFGPLQAMSATITRVEAGDLGARSLPRTLETGADEIRHLARHLDRLLAQLQDSDRQLRALNLTLNDRVAARTADLLAANHALEAATQRLILSEKLATIGEVTAGIAHEINNPLAVIQGNLEVLRMVLDGRLADVAGEIALIDAQIARITRLVGQLLHFTRPNATATPMEAPPPEGMPLPPAPFAAPRDRTDGACADPAAVIRGLPALLHHLAAPTGIALISDDTAAPKVAIAPHALEQILVNLASNALQAMQEAGLSGKIEITARPDADHGRAGVVFAVRDQGPGLDPAMLTRVFDPFFTTRSGGGAGGGTGLGLAICQSLVTDAGGRLWAESPLGAGACFRFWLPLVTGRYQPAAEE